VYLGPGPPGPGGLGLGLRAAGEDAMVRANVRVSLKRGGFPSKRCGGSGSGGKSGAPLSEGTKSRNASECGAKPSV
jgi:hypothetical protein